ncbi:MAG: magnesium and cobalt transport protein CorA, partial [Candidatus Omnitrophica bacterium]|nr:magnesium and cobalt transport protein CorA [Candidatus Omnitrophota bacterium]
MAPGSLIQSEEGVLRPVDIVVMDYTIKEFQEESVREVQDCFKYRDADTVTWINVNGVHDVSVLKTLNDHFQIHPLATEDIHNTGHRPKSEEFEEHLFLILKMLYMDPNQPDEIVSEQVSIVLGKNYVISFQEHPGDVFDPVRERIRDGKGRIRTMGPDYLAYALMDAIVDNYYSVLEQLGERVETLETAMIQDVQ